jgi:hemolysin III
MPPDTEAIKPKLRGWLHAGAAMAAAGLTAALCWRSRHDPRRLAPLAIFGGSMIELYTVSAIYHIGTWSARPARVLHALDHANIFVLIAGTYTPLCVALLPRPLRTGVLITVWVVASAGSAVTIMLPGLPRWIGTGLYIGMGWLAVIAVPQFWRVLPRWGMGFLGLGGLLYTLGGVVYARKRPDPFPQVFGFHEVFHLLTIAAGSVFATAVWLWVLPPRAIPLPEPLV